MNMKIFRDDTLVQLQLYAPIFIRLAFGFHLVQYTVGDVFELTAGSNNEEWLKSMGVPFPYFMGWVYIVTEFFGGLCLMIGFQVRVIAVLLLINFIIAYSLVHLGQPYLKSFEAIQMIAVSLFLIFNGAGKISVDNLLHERQFNRKD